MVRLLAVAMLGLLIGSAQAQQTTADVNLYPDKPGMKYTIDEGLPCAQVCPDPTHILPARIKAACDQCPPGGLLVCGGPGARCAAVRPNAGP